MVSYSAFFTGHRNYTNLETGISLLIDLALKQGINHFYSGMALGTDLSAAKVLSDRGLQWSAVIPFKEQTSRWRTRDKALYEQLMPFSCQRIILAEDYSVGLYHARNAYMIDRSQLCLAVYDGRQQGGTFNVVNQVRNRDMDMIIYDPATGKFIKTFH